MPATAAVGLVLSAPSTVNAILQFCQTVQFARQFNGDFALSSARLELAGLRVAQWAQSTGIIQAEDEPGHTHLSEREQQKAEPILNKILQAFESAEKQSQKYARDNSYQYAEAQLASPPSTDQRSLVLALRTRTRRYASNPISSDFMAKTRWMVYRKAPFEKLVGDVSEAVKELVEMFPAQKPQQQALCQRDLSVLNEPQLQAVDKIADENDDTELQKATKKVAHEKGLSFEGNTVQDRANINMGNAYNAEVRNPQGISVARNTFSGASDSRFGHSFGMPRINIPDTSRVSSDTDGAGTHYTH